MKIKILLVDQFSGVTPAQLQSNPKGFERLCSDVLSDPERQKYDTYKPEVLEVDEKEYRQPFGTTTFREGPSGSAEVWKLRWDTSG